MAHRWRNSRQAAQHLGVAEQTLANWRYMGKGPRFYRVGASVKYDEGDLDAYIEAGVVEGDRSAEGTAA